MLTRSNGNDFLSLILILHRTLDSIRYSVCRCLGGIIRDMGVAGRGFWIAVTQKLADHWQPIPVAPDALLISFGLDIEKLSFGKNTGEG